MKQLTKPIRNSLQAQTQFQNIVILDLSGYVLNCNSGWRVLQDHVIKKTKKVYSSSCIMPLVNITDTSCKTAETDLPSLRTRSRIVNKITAHQYNQL